MADYKAMYELLFKRITVAIRLLQEAQQITEDMFISSEDTNIRLLPIDSTKTKTKSNKADKNT